MQAYLRLGEILIKQGLITQEQLDKSIEAQKKEGGRIGETLILLGFVTEQDIIVALGKQLNIPYVTLGSGLLKPATDKELETLIAHEFAIKNLVLPLQKNLNSLTCAIFDPLDVILLDNIKKMTGCEVNPVIATRSDIEKAIENFYGKRSLLTKADKDSYETEQESLVEEVVSTDEELSIDKLIARAEEAPVVKLVDLILKQAIDEHASDIHIEPFSERISLRYRIDGALHEIPPPARHLHLPLVSRIKILAKLDIAEKRLPQDGGFSVRIKSRTVDLRVSSIPTIYGEKIVLRILDKGSISLELSSLGFDSRQFEDIKKGVQAPYGLIFLTGPTGSGKTTTLYSVLKEIKTIKKNVVTVEEPVEYHLDGINQVQVKPDIGLTFASALRSFLRQDPDIMMVGEVRDLETAEICVRSALTGHLVLSTLHTNDAPSAVVRLVDFGIKPFLLIPSLQLIVAQRLVRKLCPECKEPHEPSKEEREKFKLGEDLIYKPKGCEKCNYIGYRGRACVAEVLLLTDEMREALLESTQLSLIKELAKKNGMTSLSDSALRRTREGTTSLEEALSVAFI